MDLTFAEGSQAAMSAIAHPTKWEGFGCRLIKHQTKGLRSTAFSCFSPICLLMRVTFSLEPPEMTPWTAFFQVRPREKRNCCLQAWRNNSSLGFHKTTRRLLVTSEMCCKIFKRWEWETASREVFSKIMQLDICLGASQFMSYFRHMILLDTHGNSVFLPL